MEMLEIKVRGMVCNGCENRVKNALGRVEKVVEVLADHKQELVTVKANSEIDKKVIYEKIEDLGFEVIRND